MKMNRVIFLLLFTLAAFVVAHSSEIEADKQLLGQVSGHGGRHVIRSPGKGRLAMHAHAHTWDSHWAALVDHDWAQLDVEGLGKRHRTARSRVGQVGGLGKRARTTRSLSVGKRARITRSLSVGKRARITRSLSVGKRARTTRARFEGFGKRRGTRVEGFGKRRGTRVKPAAAKKAPHKVTHHYMGCYRDKKTHRAVPHYRGKIGGFFDTGRIDSPLEQCKEMAQKAGDDVFALQDGSQCWSGKKLKSNYKLYGPQSDPKLCPYGGPLTNQVYVLY